MSAFTAAEIEYLRSQPLVRLGADFPFDPAWILVTPTRIVSWGIDCSSYEVSARDVAKAG